MVTFAFYCDEYGGDSIEYEEFTRLSRRAASHLARYKRIYTVEGTEEAENMALCAMADALFYFETVSNGGAVTASSVGSVSSSYSAPQVDTSERAQERELYKCACEYLSIYRGCG